MTAVYTAAQAYMPSARRAVRLPAETDRGPPLPRPYEGPGRRGAVASAVHAVPGRDSPETRRHRPCPAYAANLGAGRAAHARAPCPRGARHRPGPAGGRRRADRLRPTTTGRTAEGPPPLGTRARGRSRRAPAGPTGPHRLRPPHWPKRAFIWNFRSGAASLPGRRPAQRREEAPGRSRTLIGQIWSGSIVQQPAVQAQERFLAARDNTTVLGLQEPVETTRGVLSSRRLRPVVVGDQTVATAHSAVSTPRIDLAAVHRASLPRLY